MGLVLSGCARSPDAPSPPAGADPPPHPEIPDPLSLEAAVSIALASDPGLRAARRRVSAERWRAIEQALPHDFTMTLSADPTEWAVSLSAAISDWLDFAGARSLRAQTARAHEEEEAADLLRREVLTAREVRETFCEVVAARRVEDFLRERQTLRAEAERLARAASDAGHLSVFALFSAEEALREARIEREEATAAREAAEARLGRFLARPPSSALPRLADEIPVDLPEGADPARSPVLPRRGELLAAAARVRATRSRLRLAEISWIPRLEGGPLLRKPGQAEPVVGGGTISLALPVPDRPAALRGIDAAEVQAAEADLLDAEARVLLDVHLAFLDYRRNLKRLETDGPERLRDARRKEALVEEAIVAGNATRDEQIDARLGGIDAELFFQRQRLATGKARAALLAALGDRGEKESEK